MTFAQALADAVDEILDEDARVTLIGARFTGHTPSAYVMDPVLRKHAARITWPPISELAYCGIAVGAAMAGLRPIVEMSTSTFSYEAIPQIVNEAGIISATSGGRVGAPVVFHMLYGIRGAGGPQHSGSPQPWYWNSPGLQVAMPSSPADVKGLLRWAALRSENPTLFMDHQRLMELEGPVPEGRYEIPFGVAEVKRRGRDLTIVATSIQVSRALEAAALLAREGIEAEVVDPRTLEPLDRETILGSVRRTGRAVVTDESHDHCGVASGLAAIIAEECFAKLRAPVRRVSIPSAPVPYAEALERALVPSAERIAAAARSVMR
ncbi:MAG TPA: transketolase C-terminal domain-containing protein [Candidatus Limnocylindria bacterium]|nr:transketolase C-terminal domain-containing protein [Candidatus Limnocylindria bacterium]